VTQKQYQELLNKFNESMQIIESLKTTTHIKVTDNQENIDGNIEPVRDGKFDHVRQSKQNKKTKNVAFEPPRNNDSSISSSANDEISKLRKEIQELSLSVREIKRHRDSPETIKMPKRNNKKGLSHLIKHADSEEERNSESPDRRLSSDSDEEYQKVTKKTKQNRKTSKTRFGTFTSKNKINDKHKGMKAHRENETDYENEFMRSKNTTQQKALVNKYEPQSEDLANSRIKYNKLTEKALDEMGQITSEDEEMIIMKKRQHMINSVKKDKPRSSKRLENMLKNAAINSEDSMDMTPSSFRASRVVPEQHPYNYAQPFNYAQTMPPMQYNPNNFYPEATFSPHAQKSYGYAPLNQSYNDGIPPQYNHAQMNQNYHEGMPPQYNHAQMSQSYHEGMPPQYNHAQMSQNYHEGMPPQYNHAQMSQNYHEGMPPQYNNAPHYQAHPMSYQQSQNMHQAPLESPIKNSYNKGLPFAGKF
jgi:hypothetical protein